METIELKATSIMHASKEMRDNDNIARMALSLNGLTLQYMSDRIKDDLKLV